MNAVQRNSIRRTAFLAAAAAAMPGVAVVCAPAKAAQFEFKCGSTKPADHPESLWIGQLWSAVERESRGRVKVLFFPNSSLGSDAAMLSQLQIGAIQFLSIGGAPLQSAVPASDITNLGFVFKDEPEALRVVDGPLGDYLRREIAAKGLFALHAIWNSGMRQITASSHPMRTADDMNGFKIRVVPSKITLDLYKDLGASPTPLAIAEVYTALQTKLVDGQDAPLATIEAFRYFEVQKYLSLTNHTWSCTWMLESGDARKSLPADIQEIVERNHTKYALLARRDTMAANAVTAAKLASQGMIANKVDQSSFRARLGAYYTSWASTFGPTAWGMLQRSISGKLG